MEKFRGGICSGVDENGWWMMTTQTHENPPRGINWIAPLFSVLNSSFNCDSLSIFDTYFRHVALDWSHFLVVIFLQSPPFISARFVNLCCGVRLLCFNHCILWALLWWIDIPLLIPGLFFFFKTLQRSLLLPNLKTSILSLINYICPWILKPTGLFEYVFLPLNVTVTQKALLESKNKSCWSLKLHYVIEVTVLNMFFLWFYIEESLKRLTINLLLKKTCKVPWQFTRWFVRNMWPFQ